MDNQTPPEGEPFASVPLVFIHIPKTAGTTFTTLLERDLPSASICPAYFPPDLLAISAAQLAQYRLIRGHFYLDLIVRLLGDRAQYITFLRDPVARAVSNYLHLQEHGQEAPDAFGERMDIEAFFFHPAVGSMRNVQCRFLGTSLELPGSPDLTRALTAETLASQVGKHADAEEALAQLERMPFFGLTEQFDESLALYSYTFARRPVLQSPHLNVSGRKVPRDALPRHIVERIMELNEDDMMLYAHAQRLFSARHAQMIHHLLDERYRRQNHAFEEELDECSVTFDGPLPQAAGWHAPEHDALGGWRWLGPDPLGVVDLPLSRARDLRIQFCVRHAITPEILASLTLSVNDHPIAFTQDADGSRGIICTGVIPSAVLEHNDYQAARMAFQVARTISPTAVDSASGDTRRLGVAIGWLNVAPGDV